MFTKLKCYAEVTYIGAAAATPTPSATLSPTVSRTPVPSRTTTLTPTKSQTPNPLLGAARITQAK